MQNERCGSALLLICLRTSCLCTLFLYMYMAPSIYIVNMSWLVMENVTSLFMASPFYIISI